MFDRFFNGNNSIDLNFDYIKDNIPEFNQLKGCQQPERWHMEGDAYNHTMKCVDVAYELLNGEYSQLSVDNKRLLLLAVLFHDIGKPKTTFYKKGDWHSYGHDVEGERIVRRVFWDEDVMFREMLCSLVRWHMEAYYLLSKGSPFDNMVKMSFNTRLEYLMFVHKCDILGSITKDNSDTGIPLENLHLMYNLANRFECYRSPFGISSLFGDKYANGRQFYLNGTNPYVEREEENRPTLYIMIGLPGSGKDTYIKNMLSTCKVLCRDDIRAELGYCKEGEKIIGTYEQEFNVSEIFDKRLVEYIKDGNDVVINNINLKRKYREGYIRMVKDYNPIVKYIYVEAPTLDDNIKRREGQIGSEVFYDMISKFEWPVTSEKYDSFLIEKEKYTENGNIYYQEKKII